jgi:hypothetical protein
MMSHVAVSRGAVAVRRLWHGPIGLRCVEVRSVLVRRSWRGEAANGKLRRVKARRSLRGGVWSVAISRGTAVN